LLSAWGWTIDVLRPKEHTRNDFLYFVPWQCLPLGKRKLCPAFFGMLRQNNSIPTWELPSLASPHIHIFKRSDSRNNILNFPAVLYVPYSWFARIDWLFFFLFLNLLPLHFGIFRLFGLAGTRHDVVTL